MLKYLSGLDPVYMAEKGLLPSDEATLATQMEIGYQLDRIANALEAENEIQNQERDKKGDNHDRP